jgi:RimJ/RimL family protein N-acetyltransferase
VGRRAHRAATRGDPRCRVLYLALPRGARTAPAPVRDHGPRHADRLALRRFEATDLDELAEVFAHPEVWQFPYGRAFTRDETERFLDAQIEEWDERGFGCWIARLRETGAVIGYVGLSVPTFLPEVLPAVEVGWRFAPAHWGKGLAGEGARAALREGFTTLGLTTICSLPQTTNPPSFTLCERLGMTLQRTIHCPPTDRRGGVDARLYELTVAGWQAQQAAGASAGTRPPNGSDLSG